MSASIAPELLEVRRRIEAEGLDLKVAARRIGVGVDVLTRHLAGEYVRSDSLAKYRRWLGKGAAAASQQLRLIEPLDAKPRSAESEVSRLAELSLVDVRRRPKRPHLVVDLFSGCGGMSLGFDLLDAGAVFETVLAVDIEEAMVRAFNANHPRNGGALHVCRRVDLSDLLNEAEVLGFYLDHLAALRRDLQLQEQLDALPGLGMSAFGKAIAGLDDRFVRQMEELRESPEYRSACKRIPAGALGQTSVIGFHDALGLPMPSAAVRRAPLVWADRSRVETDEEDALDRASRGAAFQKLSGELRSALLRRWDREVEQLRERGEGSGSGKLASSAGRIRSFLPVLDEPVMRRIRSVWLQWQSGRLALRTLMFDERTHRALQRLYQHEDRRVSVLLGGPPCQGFSRIGRGKIRSLREQQVHVQTDSEAGDVRNRLLHKYVLFLSALGPRVFLFENVRHFQAEVRTPEGTYLATEVLAEAIRDVSSAGLRYEVANRIIDASRHLVPETRERFFMVGVLSDAGQERGPVGDVAGWCLSLSEHEPVSVRVVLDGLPAPIPVSEARANGTGLEQTVDVEPGDRFGEGSAARLMCWLRQDPPPAHGGASNRMVDAHHIRNPRKDDAALFDLFGPGKRWMDYRCDDSGTLRDLQELALTLEQAVTAALNESQAGRASKILTRVDLERVKRTRQALDGSLSLRLLLESIPPMPGELRHHLITSAYLAKREGNHGDWIARLAADRPSKTIVSHMAKDTYAYIHPFQARTLSVREAARIQTFPDWYSFGQLGLVEAFRVIGNAVPPLLSHHFAERVAQILQVNEDARRDETKALVTAGRSR